MSNSSDAESLQIQVPSQARTLNRLFLTLFLRGRTSRGLHKESAPQSVGSKLATTCALYALFGLVALTFRHRPVFAVSFYLHGMTFVLLGIFIAASAGEVLFNKEEADILLHRPVTPKALLWAKAAMLVKVSLWMAGAFNLVGFFVGIGSPDGGWLFPFVHGISTSLEALFCTGCVVLVYQLCLRWFGRERLEGLMTAAQVLISVGAILGGQVVPLMLSGFGGPITFGRNTWWIGLLPPAWFAGLDDTLAGHGGRGAWVLAAFGLIATSAVLALAFGKLAQDYEKGLQTLGEVSAKTSQRRAGRRWIDVLVNAAPMKWWLRDSVARAAFLLIAAYLVRDRDVKLRVYPSLAPAVIMPIIFLLQDGAHPGGGFVIAFCSFLVGMVPVSALHLLEHSQQWRAADFFRVAPLAGPSSLCRGTRQAVTCFLTLPLVALMALFALVMRNEISNLPLMLPGIIALPIYTLSPHVGAAAPLSLANEDSKAVGRSVGILVMMAISAALSGLALWAWSGGWFSWFVLVETILVIALYARMNASLAAAEWSKLE